MENTGDRTKTIAVSTASPFKFNKSVVEAIFGRNVAESADEFSLLTLLSDKTGEAIPLPLRGLNEKPILHKDICLPSEMETEIKKILL